MQFIPDELPKKTCLACGNEKVILEFGTRIKAPDKLQTCCIDCTKAKRKKYNEKNPLKRVLTEKEKKNNRYFWNGNNGKRPL
jgi:hypothetical protein